MATITVPANYGQPVAVAVGLIPVLGFIHGSIVSSFRKGAGVPYPHSYATAEECKSNRKAYQFNCAQRAHANFLENAPQTMLSVLIAGFRYPQLAAGLGAAWVLFRGLFMYGYIYSEKPEGKGRFMGSFFWLAQMALWALSVFGVAKELM
ncbi:hypothetical protein BJX61DRAFT_541158 [Aspergillus egyptiacus]|nr:hypothetical protein BJX61DRAFT_541158 [Aspergillus egyptiacus]